jgi:hypothetical protein
MTLDTVKMNRFTLAFDDAALEREFLDEYSASMRSRVRVLWLVVAALVAALPIVGSSDIQQTTRVIRYGLIEPTMVLAVAATFASRTTFRRVFVGTTGLAVYVLLFQAQAQALLVANRVPDSATVPVDLLMSLGVSAVPPRSFSAQALASTDARAGRRSPGASSRACRAPGEPALHPSSSVGPRRRARHPPRSRASR